MTSVKKQKIAHDKIPILYVSSNENKRRAISEFYKLDKDFQKEYQLYFAKYEVTEIQGKKLDIASDKANRAFDHYRLPVLVDDASFHLDALNGFPGVYNKHFFKKNTHEDVVNIVTKCGNTLASAECCLFFMACPGVENHHTGVAVGNIVPPRKREDIEMPGGSSPILEIDTDNGKETLAELSPAEEMKYSHRGRAWVELSSDLLQPDMLRCIKHELTRNAEKFDFKKLQKVSLDYKN